MKVLVVGCFSSAEKNQRLLREVKQCVKATCASSGAQPKIELCDHAGLADFLVLEETAEFTPPVKPDVALKHFCALDFIVVDGDASIPPWREEMADLLRLVHQALEAAQWPDCKACVRLICSMIGTQMIAYLQNLRNTAWHVFNGNGNGQRLANRDEVDTTLPYVQGGAVFLDNTRGTIFSWRQDGSKGGAWAQQGNVGVFCHGNRPQELEHIRNSTVEVRTSKAEVKAMKLSAFYTHYVFKDIISRAFLVPAVRTWDLVTSCLQAQGPRMTQILAQSSRGPEILQIGPTRGVAGKEGAPVLALMFHFNPQYPVCIKLLQNFLEHQYHCLRATTNADKEDFYFRMHMLKATHKLDLVETMPAPLAAEMRSLRTCQKLRAMSSLSDYLDSESINQQAQLREGRRPWMAGPGLQRDTFEPNCISRKEQVSTLRKKHFERKCYSVLEGSFRTNSHRTGAVLRYGPHKRRLRQMRAPSSLMMLEQINKASSMLSPHPSNSDSPTLDEADSPIEDEVDVSVDDAVEEDAQHALQCPDSPKELLSSPPTPEPPKRFFTSAPFAAYESTHHYIRQGARRASTGPPID